MFSESLKVIIVVGPAGSGKSSTAQLIAERKHYTYIEEDQYWCKNGWADGLRTTEQEHKVQQQVCDDLLSAFQQNESVVLECILYEDPPYPLMSYHDFLNKHQIAYETIVLKPSLETIMQRMKARGRKEDLADEDENRKNAMHQLQCLESDYIDPTWVIDSTELSLEEVYEQFCHRERSNAL